MRGQRTEERERDRETGRGRERGRKRGRVHKSFRVRVLSATLVTGDRTKKERRARRGASEVAKLRRNLQDKTESVKRRKNDDRSEEKKRGRNGEERQRKRRGE